MISFFAILFFIGYSLSIFLIDNLWFLLATLVFNVLLIIIFKINIYNLLKNLFGILLFVIIIFAFNLIFDSVFNSLIISAKIIIVCNFSFIFSKIFNLNFIAEGISCLLYPLKIFKVDINEITLIIVIALNFISILKKEIINLKLNLKARNVKFNFITLFTKTHSIFNVFFINLFKRVDALELSLKSRGF